MEMSAGSRRLIREWDTSGGMEAHDCCCCGGGAGEGGEAGLYRQDTLIHLSRQKQTRQRRMAKFSAVALVLLLAAALVLVLTTVHRDKQLTAELPSDHSHTQQHAELMNPRAMLTAPSGNNTVSIDGEIYLEWEDKSGRAFCDGGFNYSRGDLVVPRTGLYRIFVQITFESKETLQCSNDALTLSYTIFELAKSYSRNVRLLSAVDTVKCRMLTWKKSLYSSALFKLEAGTRLRVFSQHHKYIVEGNEQQVFFGVEFLPQ